MGKSYQENADEFMLRAAINSFEAMGFEFIKDDMDRMEVEMVCNHYKSLSQQNTDLQKRVDELKLGAKNWAELYAGMNEKAIHFRDLFEKHSKLRQVSEDEQLDLVRDVETLQSKIDRAVETLQFYANENYWTIPHTTADFKTEMDEITYEEHGFKKAKDALAILKGDSDE